MVTVNCPQKQVSTVRRLSMVFEKELQRPAATSHHDSRSTWHKVVQITVNYLRLFSGQSMASELVLVYLDSYIFSWCAYQSVKFFYLNLKQAVT